MINRERLIKLTQNLIRIDSQNPGSNEYEIARFVKRHLECSGVKTKLYEFEKGRVNVVARISGASSRKSLLISPHLDTVQANKSWTVPPFSAGIKNGRIYGLGATDCKCNLAVSLEVIRSLSEDSRRPACNLIFAATADEESGSGLGLIPLLKRGILKPDAALVLDADDFRVIIAQKGLIHLKVKLRGKKAHGAYPERGINAIDAAIYILHELKSRKQQFMQNRYLKPPTINIGTIRGGDRVNVVADWCEFELDFRYLPGQQPKAIISELKNIIGRYCSKFEVEMHSIQKDYSLAETHPLVRGFSDSLRKFNIVPKLSGSEGATVITFFQDKHIPALASGFGVDGCAHAVDEYVTVSNLCKGAKILEWFLLNRADGVFCGR